jgi:hypothetical protein
MGCRLSRLNELVSSAISVGAPRTLPVVQSRVHNRNIHWHKCLGRVPIGHWSDRVCGPSAAHPWEPAGWPVPLHGHARWPSLRGRAAGESTGDLRRSVALPGATVYNIVKWVREAEGVTSQ